MGVVKDAQCIATGLVSGGISSLLWYQCYRQGWESPWINLITGIGALISLLLTIAFMDMAHLHPAESHTLKSMFLQYCFLRFTQFYGSQVQEAFKSMCKNITHSQEKLLLRDIIGPNKNTEYGRRYNFEAIKSREDYHQKVPLTTYVDYVPYIERIENNTKDLVGVLSHDPIVFLAMTSGSTGHNKVIPVTKCVKSQGRSLFAMISRIINHQQGANLLRIVRLGYKPVVRYSNTGLMKGPISYYMLKNFPFGLIPYEAFDIQDEQTALYVEAVLALGEREVVCLQGFLSTLVWAFWQGIEQNWKEICDDIENGCIRETIKLEPYIRTAVEKRITANRDRAEELRNEFRLGFKSIALRVWPKLSHVEMATSGSFANYASTLRRSYMENVRQFSMAHAASEGFIGVQTGDAIAEDPPQYTVCAPVTYLEFLFVDEERIHKDMSRKEKQKEEVFFLEELQVGHCYEVVVTSKMGLYRYKMGDVIKVVGFKDECPVYEFQYRTGHVLNVFWEKTPENVVYDSLRDFCSQLYLQLIDYTTTEDVNLLMHPEYMSNSDCKHYVLFLEATRVDGSPAMLSEQEDSLMDECLCERMELYRTLRQQNSIGPMHVMKVHPGTFGALRSHLLEKGNNQQVKMPRVLRDAQLLRLLLRACSDGESTRL